MKAGLSLKDLLALYRKQCFHAVMTDACEKAKHALGGPSALAKAIGDITSQAVSQWKRVPAERVVDVEKATGIPREELRPDIFGHAA